MHHSESSMFQDQTWSKNPLSIRVSYLHFIKSLYVIKKWRISQLRDSIRDGIFLNIFLILVWFLVLFDPSSGPCLVDCPGGICTFLMLTLDVCCPCSWLLWRRVCFLSDGEGSWQLHLVLRWVVRVNEQKLVWVWVFCRVGCHRFRWSLHSPGGSVCWFWCQPWTWCNLTVNMLLLSWSVSWPNMNFVCLINVRSYQLINKHGGCSRFKTSYPLTAGCTTCS